MRMRMKVKGFGRPISYDSFAGVVMGVVNGVRTKRKLKE
jgi:hypothetical protein